MAKHTQEPWTYGPASNYVGYWIAPVGTLPTLAAVERPRNNPDLISVECFNFPGEMEANARLIAAAPDLYRELRHLVRLLEPLEQDGGLDVPGLVTLNGARAAIAKVEETK